MSRILISILLVLSLVQAQQKKIITKYIGDDKGKTETRVKINVEDNILNLSITKDDETKKMKIDLDDEESLAELEEIIQKEGIDLNLNEIYCYDNKKQGYLGVHIQNLTDQLRDYFKAKDNKGVLVSEVEEGSPAAKAKLEAGDVIVKVDDKYIASAKDLTKVISSYEPETEVRVTLLRNGRSKTLKATLGTREMQDRWSYKWRKPHSKDWDRLKLLKRFDIPEHDFDMKKFEDHIFFPQKELEKEVKELKKDLEQMKKELKELKAE